MLRTMGNYNLGFKTIIATLGIILSLTGCSEHTKDSIKFVLNEFGFIHPKETTTELSLNRQEIEQEFSIAEYCKEEYDSIFILQPYYYTGKDEFKKLNMSNRLRSKCDYFINFEHFSTILFISNGKVKAYSVIERIDADFATMEIEKQHIFPFEQKFIMDKNRDVHIYNE